MRFSSGMIFQLVQSTTTNLWSFRSADSTSYVEVLGAPNLDPGEVAVLLTVFLEPFAALEPPRLAAGEHGGYPYGLRLLQGLWDVRDVGDVEDYLFLRRWQRS